MAIMLEPPPPWDGVRSDHVARLVRGERPGFSESEHARRRSLVRAAADATGCDAVLAYGANRSGSAVPWLTGWPVTREAALLLDPHGADDLMLVQFRNHVPQATDLATSCEVRWGGPSTAESLDEAMRGRGVRRVGVIGAPGPRLHDRLAQDGREVVDLSGHYVTMRLVKSDEELSWLAAGAALSDRAVLALRDGLTPGMTDHELLDRVERAYVPLGGRTHIHYLAITSMTDPDRPAPRQWPSGRRVEPGDVVLTELSAAIDGYAGQVLRTLTMDEALSPRLQEQHDVAQAAFLAVCAALRPGATAAELVAAAAVIEEAGFTALDDLVHGFGGGYLPPVIGAASRPAGPLPTLALEAGMTVVVQPNVVTHDGRAGVQTGELVVVTEDGARSLHTVPQGPWVGAGAA